VAVGLLIASLAHGLYNTLLLERPAVRTLVVPLLFVEGAVLIGLVRRAREEDLSHIVELLRDLPALANAPTSSLRMLATRALRRRVPTGERVFKEGDPSRAVYLVLDGHMKVDRLAVGGRDPHAREQLGTLDAGAFFGEFGVLLEQARSASVVAETDAMLLELSVTGLHEVVAVVDGLGEDLHDVAQDRGASASLLPSLAEMQRKAAAQEIEQQGRLAPGSVAARLRAVPLLAGLRVGALQLLAAGAERETRRRRSVLLREGAPARGLCVILEGQAGVYQDGALVAELGPGDWFGEIGLLTGFAASATVRSLTEVELAVVDGAALRGVVGLVPEVGQVLLQGIRARSLEDRRRHRPTPAASSRVIGLLRRAAARLGFGRAATETEDARILLLAVPELLEFPTAAAEVLAELGRPGSTPEADRAAVRLSVKRPDLLPHGWVLPEERVEDALARCPHLLHLLAREAALAEPSDEAGAADLRT
jgi:CRP-like cAMP-binding protein